MVFESEQTIVLLEAQCEYMNMNDEDVEFDINEKLTETEAEVQSATGSTQVNSSTQATKHPRKRQKNPTCLEKRWLSAFIVIQN